MAIITEFINFIVPIKIIEQKYPGGWAQCLYDTVLTAKDYKGTFKNVPI